MRRQPIVAQSRELDLPMTPMIDVVFQLLIFFLCTTRFTPLEHVLPTPLEQPGSVTSAQALPPELIDVEEVVIKLHPGVPGVSVTVNGRRVKDFTELQDVLLAIARIRKDLPIIIDPEVSVIIQDVISTYDLCRELGFSRVLFAAPGSP